MKPLSRRGFVGKQIGLLKIGVFFKCFFASPLRGIVDQRDLLLFLAPPMDFLYASSESAISLSAGPTFFQKKVGEKTPAFHSTRRPPQFTKCRPTPPQACFMAFLKGALYRVSLLFRGIFDLSEKNMRRFIFPLLPRKYPHPSFH